MYSTVFLWGERIRTMKKSKAVTLGLLASVAGAAMQGCGAPTPSGPVDAQFQQCVDAEGHVLPDSECEKQQQQQASGSYAPGGMHMMPFWIYHMGRPYPMGATVPNAANFSSPLQNTPVERGSAALRAGYSGTGKGYYGGGASVSRGGFGGFGSGHVGA